MEDRSQTLTHRQTIIIAGICLLLIITSIMTLLGYGRGYRIPADVLSIVERAIWSLISGCTAAFFTILLNRKRSILRVFSLALAALAGLIPWLSVSLFTPAREFGVLAFSLPLLVAAFKRATIQERLRLLLSAAFLQIMAWQTDFFIWGFLSLFLLIYSAGEVWPSVREVLEEAERRDRERVQRYPALRWIETGFYVLLGIMGVAALLLWVRISSMGGHVQ